MKRLYLLLIIAIHSLLCFSNEGVPFFVNYTSDVYKAHNRNFDIVCDNYGTVFVANFEGLLYYDQAQWRIIHTPGISRITSLFKDREGRIWVGGYNVFGYVTANSRGLLQLKVLHSDASKQLLGEVSAITEHNGQLSFKTSDGKTYRVTGEKVVAQKVVNSKTDKLLATDKSNQVLSLNNGWTLSATEGTGLVVDEHNGTGTYSLTEANGLCNNNVNHLAYDGKGALWGATDKGLFCVGMPSVFTRFTSTEGLKGEVTAINSIGSQIYAGTMQGLYVQRGRSFVLVSGVTQACWQLSKSADGSLYAATSDGLFQVKGSGASRINKNYTLSILAAGGGTYYTGELDGIYLNTYGGQRTKVAGIEKTKNLIRDTKGAIWAETVYGQVFVKELSDKQFVNVAVKARLKQDDILTLFNNNGEVGILNHQGLLMWCNKSKCFKLVGSPRKERFDNYPQFIYFDKFGKVWQTNSEGRFLGVAANNKRATQYDSWLHPLRDLTVNAMNVGSQDIWFGGDFGLIHWASTSPDIEYKGKSNVYIRSVVLGKDSVIWGGYRIEGDVLKPQMRNEDVDFGSNDRKITFTFSTDHAATFGKTEYRYRLKGYSEWSAWSAETVAGYENLWYGSYEFQVMARDKYGRVTTTTVYPFSIEYPLYFRWYSVFFYILILALLVMAVIRLRMRRLVKEKMRLEKVVEERTSELRQRNEEVEEKSKSLEQALNELSNAQNQLIHQEKMATVGKLTKGLIDRILNPMNYINNFSHLSQGLVKDVRQDLDDEKEKMTPDNYEDALDVLSMVNANLEKIEQHGMNTTRIIKAMEEMLKDRSGNLKLVGLAAMLTKIFEVINKYHEVKIKKYGIKTELINCSESIEIEANAEQLSKTIMSLIDNSIYALAKKYEHSPFAPELKVTVETADEQVKIHIHDNGIGIEKTIINNIFDPFFTTKTTGEAAGVGLYLSHEIISDLGGTITVSSEKDQFTEFLVTLPIKTKNSSNGTD